MQFFCSQTLYQSKHITSMSILFLRFIRYLPLLSVPILHQKLQTGNSLYRQEIQTSIERMYLSPLDASVSEFKLFQLDSGELGRQVAAHLDTSLAGISSEKFNDGECNIQILNSIRGHNVYLIKRFKSKQINDGIVQLLIAVNTLKKQGASTVTCFIPFFPYCQSNDCLLEQSTTFFTSFGSDILKMLEDSGCDRVITFNSLMPYPKGFVNACTFININAPDLFVGHLATKKLRDPVLVSTYINTPNVNNLHIFKEALKKLNYDCPISTFNEDTYIGDNVKGRDVILYSNVLRTGKTFIRLSKILKEMGAKSIYGCAFHSLSTDEEMKGIIRDSYLKELLTTNSLSHIKHSKKVHTTTLARVIAQTITLFEEQKSLSDYRIDLERRKRQFMQNIKRQNHKNSTKKASQVI